jgi:hypothetical protein
MRLYKNEAVGLQFTTIPAFSLTGQDEEPIQTIHLDQGVRIEHAYEESQVQGSWKIMSGEEVCVQRGDKLIVIVCPGFG